MVQVVIVILLLLLMAAFLVVKEVFGASVVVLVQLLHNCLTFAPTLAYKKIGLLVNGLSSLTSHLSLLLVMK